MKKIVFSLALVLLVNIVPTKVMASGPPPNSTAPVVALGAVVAGYFLFFSGSAAAPAAKATGNEFQDLNNNPAFKNLLNQVAGGSLNTLEILK